MFLNLTGIKQDTRENGFAKLREALLAERKRSVPCANYSHFPTPRPCANYSRFPTPRPRRHSAELEHQRLPDLPLRVLPDYSALVIMPNPKGPGCTEDCKAAECQCGTHCQCTRDCPCSDCHKASCKCSDSGSCACGVGCTGPLSCKCEDDCSCH